MPTKPNMNAISETRHKRLYFPDGDIVLSASNKNVDAGSDSVSAGTTLFRIDKVYLFRNSPVFKDLLSIPAQTNANEMYDGVVRVRMPDDADDLAQLIGALYDTSTLKLESMDPDLPLNISNVLKLGQKYQVSLICTVIRHSLSEAWPQSLTAWDRQRAGLYAVAQELKNISSGKIDGKYLNGMFPEPGSAIGLAVECDLPEVLPIAMYQLALLDPEADWSTASDEYLRKVGRAARWDMVDRVHLLRVIRGRQKLLKLSKVGISLSHSKSCDGRYCGLEGAVDQFNDDEVDHLRALQVLQEYVAKNERSSAHQAIAAVCVHNAIVQIQSTRQAFWSGLAKFFEIGA